MKLIRKNNKKGFTLVELIVVIAIIAILALILIPAITGYTAKANDSALEASARSLQTKAVLYYSENNSVTGMAEDLEGSYDEDKYKVTTPEALEDGKGFKFYVTFKGRSIEVTDSGLGEISDAKPAAPGTGGGDS